MSYTVITAIVATASIAHAWEPEVRKAIPVEPEVRKAIPIEPETPAPPEVKSTPEPEATPASRQVPATIPTLLSEYSTTIDDHFTVDVGSNWKRYRENGDSCGVLFRGSLLGDSPDKLGVRIALVGVYDEPKKSMTDEEMQRMTNAAIKDLGLESRNSNPRQNGITTVTKTAFKRTTVSGIDAVQIDLTTNNVFGKGKSYEHTTVWLYRNVLLIFEDGRAYWVTVFGCGPMHESKLAGVINSIFPVRKPVVPLLVPTPTPHRTPSFFKSI